MDNPMTSDRHWTPPHVSQEQRRAESEGSQYRRALRQRGNKLVTAADFKTLPERLAGQKKALAEFYQDQPIPKVGIRKRDPKVLKAARKRKRCELCGVRTQLEAAHLKSKGSGGHDIPENVLGLCHECHTASHHAEISKETLKAAVAARRGK